MLIGEYKHLIDDKKRMSLPAKFRKEMGKRVVITYGLDKCLFLYTQKQWEAVAEKLSQLSMGAAEQREFNRFMLAGAVEVEVDALGRILIPDFLKEFARLKDSVVVAGVYTRVEIWDHDLWQERKAEVALKVDALAERLGEVGLI
ncbi:MAG: cell division/cell wall cluster transcriptional repressor MraZ [Parcubacteria group bacterium RIFOXYD2_FULL_52_8]|nr:MAG: cell division/cell wall cluster transcriptional repressor MraZ [Parcubacteria group bacterium RIFOXYD2_FULL_52_8]